MSASTNLSFNHIKAYKLLCFFGLLFCGVLNSHVVAAAYDFPNNLPPGCSGSAGTYTCNIDSQMNYDVTFSDTGNVTINHNGDYRLGGGYSAGTASQSANVTINLVDPDANTNLELYSGSNVYANFNVTTSSSSRDIQISMSGTAAVHGDINASSQDNVLFDMYDNSVVNGDVNTFGTDYASVEIRSNATVNGNVVADSNATDNGDIVFYDPGVTITGDVTAHGDITTSGTINGCVLITDTYSGARLTLYSGSSTANICKGTVGSCYSSSSYVNNYTGSAPPPVCEAEPYDFPNNLPPGCSGSGGVYDCTINSEMDYNVTFSDAGDVTVNHYGRYDLAAGRYAGTATQTANVTINVVSPTSGDTYIDLATGTNVYANFNATTYSSNYSVRATMDGTATIHGNFVADSQEHVYLYMNDDSVLNGDVDASAYIYIFVELYDNATINGDVSAITDDSYSFHAGNVRLKSAGARVNGNVSAATGGQISNRGTITGCALLADNDSGSEIELSSGSTTGSICQGTVGACAASSTYLRNFTSTTPPDCVAPTVLIAEYHLDEQSWNGTANEVKDTANYSGGPFDGQAIGSLPTTNAVNPALGNATTGTCGYAAFNGANSAITLDNLPVSTVNSDKTSVSFWMYWDGDTSSRMLVGWGYYGLSIDSDLGFDTFTNSRYGIASSELTIGWHHMVAVFTNGGFTGNELYVDGVKKTLTQRRNAPNNANAYVQSTLKLAGITNSTAYGFDGGFIDQVRVYRGAISQTQVSADYAATHACPIYVTNTPASNFNCVATGADADTGHLYLQKTGTEFNVDVVALKSDRSVETTFAEASNQDVTVELVNGAGTTACAARAVLSPTVSQTVTFSAADAGRKTIPITVNKAYRDLRCRVTDANQSPTVTGCSSDHFVVKPATLTVTATSANADTTATNALATPPAIKTGADFTLTVNASVGYEGRPSIDLNKLSPHSGATQAGNLTGVFNTATVTTGETTGTFQYSEVGYFQLLAQGIYDDGFTAVDSANGDCAPGASDSGGLYGCRITHTAATQFFGRFTPDHFTVSNIISTPACGSFNYYGQDSVSTGFTLTAQNSAGDTTQNYTGDYAHLVPGSWSSTTGLRFSATGITAGSLSSGAAAPTGSWSNGVANITATHTINRLTSPMAPADVTIITQPIDMDMITTSSPIVLASNVPFRYGRITMSNVYGSELRALNLAIEAQYWDGNSYRTNEDDNCTTVSTADVTLSNYTKNLNAGETTLTGGGLMNQGLSILTLSKPGPSNSGSLDLSLTLLSLPWLDAGVAPEAKATFGIHKTPFLYIRDSF